MFMGALLHFTPRHLEWSVSRSGYILCEATKFAGDVLKNDLFDIIELRSEAATPLCVCVCVCIMYTFAFRLRNNAVVVVIVVFVIQFVVVYIYVPTEPPHSPDLHGC